MHIMGSFSSNIMIEKILSSKIQIDRSTIQIGSVDSYEKGLDVLKNLNTSEINSAVWVGLDTRTEKKLAEIETSMCYDVIKRLQVLERKEFQSFEEEEKSSKGGVVDIVLKKVLEHFNELVDKNVDMITFKEKQLRIPEVDA